MPRTTRTDTVFEGLLRRLALREWPPGERLPPVRTLEADFAVSRTTVLGALRRAADEGLLDVRPRQSVIVRSQAAQLAKDLLAELGKRARARRLAALFPESFGPPDKALFFRDLLAAVLRQARRAGIKTESVAWPMLDQATFARRLRDQGFGAAFAMGVRAEYVTSLYTLHRERFPVVLFNSVIPDLSLPGVNLDEYGAARQIALHLVSRGHRNLCMVSEAFDARLKAFQHRVYGWVDALNEAGVMDSCVMPICFVTPREDLRKDFGRIFAFPNRPTAIAFAYGSLFEQFLRSPAYHHIRIPEQLSVTTFDAVSSPHKSSRCPPVTTITNDMTRTAQCVVEMVEHLLGGNLELPSIRVPMQVNLTESIGVAPSLAAGQFA
jgi:DNA-binding LacI/PurR family transcriptional regulator